MATESRTTSGSEYLEEQEEEIAVARRMTLWINTITGERLDRDALDDLRGKAHRAYEANPHIFEDEYEALRALGAVPLNRLHEAARAIA
jgi:hypothetical protein